MLIVEVMGGLGNPLQQYALYRKLKSLGREAKLDVSWYEQEKRQENVLAPRRLELSFFENLPMELCTKEEKERLAGGDGLAGKLRRRLAPKTVRRFRETDLYHPEIFSLTDCYLTGFWACEKYYADILPQLRKEIVFPKQDETHRNSLTIRKMKEEMSVSIHIRRGDYLDPENAAMFGGICTENYYDGAVRLVLERCPDAHFYLFSDDPDYARDRYRGDRYTVVDWNAGADSFYDILLMSSCRHNICANSTFSFWGARLNPGPDKIMIRPAKHKNSQRANPEELHELWPGWTIVDGGGKEI